MSDELSPIAQAQAGFHLGEELLRAYTPERYVLAQAMGLSWPYIGEDGVSQMTSTGMYAGHPKDVAILLWVLRLKDAAEQTPDELRAREWNVSKAMLNPKGAVVAAIGWAASAGYLMPQTQPFEEASKLFYEITNPVEAAKFQVSQGAEGDDSGPKL